MRTLLLFSSILALSIAAGACGSGSASPDAGGTDAGGDGSSAPDARDSAHPADSGDGGARDAAPDATPEGGDGEAGDASDAAPDVVATGCPASPPAPYSPCSEALLFCSWGTDPRFQCRQRAECNSYLLPDGGTPPGLVWRSGDDNIDALSCPTPPPSCPATAPTMADGGAGNPPCDASQAGLTCVYGDEAMTCAPCPGPTLCFPGKDGGPTYQWFQSKMPTDCPSGPPGTPLPNWGSTCSTPGLYCNYNKCASTESGAAAWAWGVLLRCQSDGTWTGLDTIDGGVCL